MRRGVHERAVDIELHRLTGAGDSHMSPLAIIAHSHPCWCGGFHPIPPLGIQREGREGEASVGLHEEHAGDFAIIRAALRKDRRLLGNKIEDTSCYGKWDNAHGKVPPKLTIHVWQKNFFSPLTDAVGGFFTNLFGAFSPQVQQALAGNQIDGNSRQIGVSGAGFVHLTNGSIVVPLLGSRALVAGPSGLVHASDFNVLSDDGIARVAVGHQYTAGFEISGIQNQGSTAWAPGDVLTGLRQTGTSLVAAGAGNMVAAGGLNMVAAGGGNLGVTK